MSLCPHGNGLLKLFSRIHHGKVVIGIPGAPISKAVPSSFQQDLQQLRSTLVDALQEAKQTEALNNLVRCCSDWHIYPSSKSSLSHRQGSGII